MSLSQAKSHKGEGDSRVSARPSGSLMRIVLVEDRHSELTNIKQTLSASGLVRVIAESTSTALAASLAQRHEPDALFLSMNQARGDIAGLVQSVRRLAPGVAVVLMGPRDGELILRSFREGVDEYLPKPLDMQELSSAVERLRTRPSSHPEADVAGGKVVGVWGGRGGCGATTLACNLAFVLGQKEPTVLVDFHFNQGDMAIHLNVEPALSLADLLESDERIDTTLVESVALKHKHGFSVLTQPMNQPLESAARESMDLLIRALRRMFSYIVIDLGHDWSAIDPIISHIDAACVATRQDLATLYVARRKVAWLAQNGVSKDSVAVAVNSYRRTNEVDIKRMSEALGRLNYYTIRQDERTVIKAINQGAPLRKVSRWAGIARDIERMAADWKALQREAEEEDAEQHKSEDDLPSLMPLDQALR